MHPIFARMCLKTKCFCEALPVIDIDVFDFPMSRSGSNEVDLSDRVMEVTYQDVLSYFLFAAIIYLGVKNWRRSMDLLSYVS